MSLTYEQVLAKSAARILGLHQTVKKATESLIQESYLKGIPIVISQGLRTLTEQTNLYNQGRFGNPGPIVTNAKAGKSYHNYGLAVDFCLLLPNGKEVSWSTTRDGNLDLLPDWAQVVTIAKKYDFAWGGDWRSFKDMPHFEMTFGLSIADLVAGKRPATNPSDIAPLFPSKGEKRMEAADANKIIEKWLKPAYGAAKSKAEGIEIGRLADELRKVSGQKTQN